MEKDALNRLSKKENLIQPGDTMNDTLEKIKKFKLSAKDRTELEKAKKALATFLKKYPFRENPKAIDSLTEQQIYDVGSDDYFFLWIEQRFLCPPVHDLWLGPLPS